MPVGHMFLEHIYCADLIVKLFTWVDLYQVSIVKAANSTQGVLPPPKGVIWQALHPAAFDSPAQMAGCPWAAKLVGCSLQHEPRAEL